MDDKGIAGVGQRRTGQLDQGARHGWGRCGRALGFDQREPSRTPRHDEVYLEPLLVAEVVQLDAATTIDLLLREFRRHCALRRGAASTRART